LTLAALCLGSFKEGGYEGGGAIIYYDRPTRFTPGIEDRIVGTVHNLLPRQFVPPLNSQP
jgi:hypothetical protein